MIEIDGLTKRYGGTLAVDDLTFSVEPGKVTGFLGPNGAGKTTTMRMILGLDRPTEGTVTVHGRAFGQLVWPMREVGALLDAKAVHGGRSAYNHLLCLAQTNNLPRRRVSEVLELVGLQDVARKRSKGFSLGMSQRLGIAAALLGDPATLMFDEPVNGLDPDGILWIRNLMKGLAAEGRTVFVSSHLMSEMENTADRLIVIGRGRLIADCTVTEFIDANSTQKVRVLTPQRDLLAKVAVAAGGTICEDGDGVIIVQGLLPSHVGDLAFENGIRLHELAAAHASLEEAFMERLLACSSAQAFRRTPAAIRNTQERWPEMATVTTPVVPAGTRMHQRGGRAGFAGALRSEFTKIRSVRPTYWSLITLIVVTVGIGAAAGASAAHSGPGQLGASFDPTQTSLYGLVLSQLIIAVLGVLTVTSEYSTGMMRTSLTSMPRRGTMIAAKAVVLATVALVTGLVASFGAFFIGQGLMSGHHIGATLGQPHVLRAVISGALFLTVSGLLGLGLGLILRHAAVAISAVVGLLFVLFILALQLPSSWHVSTWIPLNAGSQVWQTVASPASAHMLSAWTGFALFCGYAAAAIIGGLILFARRDA